MPLTDNLVRMWAVWEGFTNQAAWIHNFSLVSMSSSIKQDLMTTWLTGVLPSILPVMSSDYDLTKLYVQDIVPGTDPDEDFAGGLTAIGTDSSGPVPGQSSVVVTWNSTLSGRSNRGRTYFPGLAVGQLSDGLLGFGAQAAYAAYANALLDAFTPRVAPPFAQLGTISKQQSGSPRGPLLIETTDFIIRLSLGVRKKRRQGFGS